MAQDYYSLLGVGRDAEADEIKKAYRKVAMKYHPDRSDAPDAEERFKEVTRAYEVLRDPKLRRIYDTHGEAGLRRLIAELDRQLRLSGIEFRQL